MSDHLGPLTGQLHACKVGLQVSKMRNCARIMLCSGHIRVMRYHLVKILSN